VPEITSDRLAGAVYDMRCSQWENVVDFIIPIWLSLLSFEASMLADMSVGIAYRVQRSFTCQLVSR